VKLLFISHSSVLKYHQQKLEILAEKYGHEIILAAPPRWREGGVDTPLYDKSPRIKYIEGKTVFLKKPSVYFYTNAQKIVRQANPDIIHIEEEPFDTPCYQFVKAGKKAGKKILFFTWENIERKHGPFYAYFERYCLKNSGCAIAGNSEGKRILEKKGFKGTIDVMPQYGVNIHGFKEKTIEFPKDVFTVGYLGRMTQEKGIETLLEAVKDINKVRVVAAGAGEKKYIDTLVEIIREYKIGSKVELMGHIAPEGIPDFLNKMDILAVPSITTAGWKEQFGRVIVEAFASRVPVIGSSSGEIPNVIGAAGLVFEEGNSEDLKKNIIRMISDSSLYASCVEKGYHRAKENYTNEIIAAKLNEIYKNLMSGS